MLNDLIIPTGVNINNTNLENNIIFKTLIIKMNIKNSFISNIDLFSNFINNNDDYFKISINDGILLIIYKYQNKEYSLSFNRQVISPNVVNSFKKINVFSFVFLKSNIVVYLNNYMVTTFPIKFNIKTINSINKFRIKENDNNISLTYKIFEKELNLDEIVMFYFEDGDKV